MEAVKSGKLSVLLCAVHLTQSLSGSLFSCTLCACGYGGAWGGWATLNASLRQQTFVGTEINEQSVQYRGQEEEMRLCGTLTSGMTLNESLLRSCSVF